MYNNINPKYKSFLFFLIKLAIIVGSLYFIYNKIVNNNQLNVDEFLKQLNVVLFKNNWTLFFLLLFTFFNWYFEIWKWKILANQVEKITFIQATIQSLASHTISLLTPNRIGEYGGKALYFPKNKGKIVLLNLIGNLYQLLATILFGVIGLIYFVSTYNIEIEPTRIRGFAYFIGFIILLFVVNKNRKLFYFFDIEKVISYVKNLSTKLHVKLIILSFIRYVIFSHQFYFLIFLFGIKLDYQTLLFSIFAMYFIASLIPTISIFDWAIKGSVAIYIFSYLNIPELKIVSITTLMWVLNFALPAVLGCFFILKFKTPDKK